MESWSHQFTIRWLHDDAKVSREDITQLNDINGEILLGLDKAKLANEYKFKEDAAE